MKGQMHEGTKGSVYLLIFIEDYISIDLEIFFPIYLSF